MDVIVDVLHEPGDLVLIGTPPAGPAGVGIVAIPAGELHVDPTAPDDPPFAVIHDAAEAADAITGVFGPVVAAAVVRAPYGQESSPARPGPVAGTVRTLGLLGWLESWSPDVLPAGVLDIELGSTVIGLDDTVADHVLEDCTARLLRRAGLVAELSRRLRDTGEPDPPPALSALVARAVPLLRGVLPADHPGYDDVEHEDELGRALAALSADGPRLDWAAIAELPSVGVRELVGATDLGEATTGDGHHVCSVDWYQVPRGLLDTAEDTVRWSVSDSVSDTAGAAEITVAVRAQTGAPDSDRLAFRLYAQGRPLPVAGGRLRRTRDGAEFVGRAPVFDATGVSRAVLDIYDALDTRPPRLGTSRTSARAMRWAARAVSGLRLGDRSSETGQVARGGLEEAARLFATVAATSTDPARQTLARRRRARCVALVRAILTAEGQQRAADQMGRRWSPPPSEIHEADVRLPDVSRSGWARLVTEHVLLAGPTWRAP